MKPIATRRNPDAPEHAALSAAGRRDELAGGVSRRNSKTTRPRWPATPSPTARTTAHAATSPRPRASRSISSRPDLPRRGLPVTTRDPLGNDTTIAYDRPYHLLPVQVTDAVGLTIQRRVRLPCPATPHGHGRQRQPPRRELQPLGLVTATAVMGKEGEQVGDTLEAPGSRLEYDFFAFVNRQQPVFVRSIVREHHVTETDVPLPERDETIETVEYSDGFGRLLQTRTQAEDVLFGDPTFGGGVLPADQSSRHGRCGRPAAGGRRSAERDRQRLAGLRQQGPRGREVRAFLRRRAGTTRRPSDAQFGQKATMFYDPRGQVIRTLNPDGSEQRVIYGIPADLDQPRPVRTHALGGLHLRRERSGAAELRGAGRRTARRLPHRRPITSRRRAS